MTCNCSITCIHTYIHTYIDGDSFNLRMGDLSRRRLGGGDWPDPGEIGAETWAVAEEAAKEVVWCVHPTLDSEEKRKDVIEYIQKLIRDHLNIEVFPYGSVPLKTYLPDGDIDLTALTCSITVDTLPHDVLAVLQCEESNQYADYEVKDTQFINAEVKLVKCLVQNIVVDLSFNQLGGLCTLCFLEQVDRHVGKNHLFKRSIILVKTWCYYESRILGAHHGLISTYAMEILVLYIFHLFHASLDGPLAVLYKFLDYFSKFDWDNYCISLNGPVSKSCLPDLVVDKAHSVQNNGYLLNEDFLRNCIDMFSVPSSGVDTSLQMFTTKYLNIIDPLKENNNLGRSVNRGNFYRIRSAFKYGARKLGRIFMLPRDRIGDEIKRFFANTFERDGRHVGNLAPPSHSRSFAEEKIQFNRASLYSESNTTSGNYELDRHSTEINHILATSKIGRPVDEMGLSGSLPAGEICQSPPNYQLDCSASTCYGSDSTSQYYASHFQYPESFTVSGTLDGWMLNEGKAANIVNEKADSDLIGEQWDNHLQPCSVRCCLSDNYDHSSNFSSGIMSLDGSISEDLGLDFREKDLVDVGSPENSNPLSDLSGDYDSHIRSLLYGQCCHGHALSAPLMSHPPPTFASQFESKKPWNTARRSMSMTHCSSSYLIDDRVNLGLVTQPGNIPCNISGHSNPTLCNEENHNKPRGTGTYIPNGCACWEKPSHGKGRYHGPGNYCQYQRTRSTPVVHGKESLDEGGLSHEQLPKAS